MLLLSKSFKNKSLVIQNYLQIKTNPRTTTITSYSLSVEPANKNLHFFLAFQQKTIISSYNTDGALKSTGYL